MSRWGFNDRIDEASRDDWLGEPSVQRVEKLRSKMAMSGGQERESMRRQPRFFLLFCLLTALFGCSLRVDANRVQCSQDSDCAKRGPAFAGSVCLANICTSDPKWSCVGDPPPTIPTGTFRVTFHVQEVVGSAPLPGVTAQLCRKLDLTCEKPLGKALSDDKGTFTMAVDGNFDGYVQLTEPSIAPSLYFFNPPVSADADLPPISLASPLIAAGIAFQAGGTLLADHGIMLLTTGDCLSQPAANISYSVGGTRDPATFIFYLVAGLPTSDTTSTDSTGYGGLVNLPPGVATITAVLNPEQRKVGTISLLVRAGFVTYSHIYAGAM